MGVCVNHPDRETSLQCMKYQLYLCDQCATCRDPKIYCKHRSACPIWFMRKRHAARNGELKPGHANGRAVTIETPCRPAANP